MATADSDGMHLLNGKTTNGTNYV